MDYEQSTEEVVPQEETQEESYQMPNVFDDGSSSTTEQEELETGDESVSEEPQKQKAKGDLSVALKKERMLRQQREAELAQLRAQATTKGTQPAVDPNTISQLVQWQIANEKSKEKAMSVLPELSSDREIQVMVTALMYDDSGRQVRNAEQAAKIVAKRMGKLVEEKAEALVNERSAVQNAKEQATTAGASVPSSSSDSDIDAIRQRIKASQSPKERAKLQAELIRLKLS